MRQRVAFLRTLLAGKDVLLLDEPFGALDAITRAELQEWLAAALAAEPRTVLLVTHDVEEALLLCDRVVVLPAGGSRPSSTSHVERGGTRREIVTSRGVRRAARARAGGDRMSRGSGRRWLLLARSRSAAGSSSVRATARARTTSSPLRPRSAAVASRGQRPARASDAWRHGPRGAARATCSRSRSGSAVAVVLHFSAALRRALLPILVFSQTVPTVVLAPILAIVLGYGLGPKLVVIALVCFFPLVVDAVDGLRSTDPELVRMMRTLDASRVRDLPPRRVPGALPAIFSGARVAATYAAVGAVFAEWAGSSAGLGFVMLQAQPSLETARIFAAVLILSAIALALYGAGLARGASPRPLAERGWQCVDRLLAAARAPRSRSFPPAAGGAAEGDAAPRLDAEPRSRRLLFRP